MMGIPICTRQLTGLVNNNNSCYINSLLQIFAQSDSFVRFWLRFPSVTEKPGSALALNLLKFYGGEACIDVTAEKQAAVAAIRNAFQTPEFPQNSQADTHAFFVYYLQLIDLEIGNTQFSEIFKHEWEMKTECGRCKRIRTTSGISETQQVSLHHANLQNSLLETPSAPLCSECTSPAQVVSYTVTKHPAVLAVLTNRFSLHGANTVEISCPKNMVYFGKVYQVIGSINYYPLSAQGGHYDVNILDIHGRRVISDEHVSRPVDEGLGMLSRHSYLIFYELGQQPMEPFLTVGATDSTGQSLHYQVGFLANN